MHTFSYVRMYGGMSSPSLPLYLYISSCAFFPTFFVYFRSVCMYYAVCHIFLYIMENYVGLIREAKPDFRFLMLVHVLDVVHTHKHEHTHTSYRICSQPNLKFNLCQTLKAKPITVFFSASSSSCLLFSCICAKWASRRLLFAHRIKHTLITQFKTCSNFEVRV